MRVRLLTNRRPSTDAESALSDALGSRHGWLPRFPNGAAPAGRRRVLELLLGAEQRVEHLRAQLLAAGERDAAAEREHQQLAAETAAFPNPPLGRFAQRERRVADRLEGVAKVTLQLLVLEQRLARRLAVAEASVGALR